MPAAGPTERNLAELPLLDFVPALSPRWERPNHLAPIADAIERATREELRIAFSVPPQHGKTELLKHALVWLLCRRPDRRNVYATYGIKRGYRIGKQMRDLAERAGLSPEGSQELWSIAGGGSVFSTGIGGGLTGEPADGVVVFDDPHKNRKEANSAVYRQDVIDFMSSAVETRMHPGASLLLVHTRWHPDDAIGTVAREQGWEVINLPAIQDGTDSHTGRPIGAPLWPSQRPLAWLEAKRKKLLGGEHDWASLYQGHPRPKGGTVFSEPHTFKLGATPTEHLPSWGVRYAIGIDLAYTSKTSSDWSVAVVMSEHGGRFCVLEVLRAQARPREFAVQLQELCSRYPTASCYWRASGTEQGVVDLLNAQGLNIVAVPIKGDKFTLAQPVAAAWNRGEVCVPDKPPPWQPAFLRTVLNFTGVNDAYDDDVDALGTAYDELAVASGDYSIIGINRD